MTDILLCGVGGQGTVLASKLLARAAMNAGLFVRTSETIGMAQRGGSVVSHVRIGDSSSSMIPVGHADIIIGFEPAEAVRNLGYLRENGAVVVNSNGVLPVTASLGACSYEPDAMIEYLRSCIGRLSVIDGPALCEKCGSPKVLNVALLGAAAAAGLPDITLEALDGAVRATVPERFIELNINALHTGFDAAK